MKTVLIVEDSGPGREVYAHALQAHGYRVVQAGDGAEAVRLATEDPPDLILMNVSVPVVSGVDATEILKAHPATEHIPILIVTGHLSPTVQEDAWRAGCDDYLPKPLRPSNLLRTVAQHIGPAA